ncbi:MAG: hypothetical protein ACREEB_00835 [Caulobacteraceae bacterium]
MADQRDEPDLMSGALDLMLGGKGGGGGGGGSPGALDWNDILGPASGGIGVNNYQTISGITGAMTIAATITGLGKIFYNLNGVLNWYNGGLGTGPFNVMNADVLSWGAEASGGVWTSGTVTVLNGATTLDSFTYLVK